MSASCPIMEVGFPTLAQDAATACPARLLFTRIARAQASNP